VRPFDWSTTDIEAYQTRYDASSGQAAYVKNAYYMPDVRTLASIHHAHRCPHGTSVVDADPINEVRILHYKFHPNVKSDLLVQDTLLAEVYGSKIRAYLHSAEHGTH